VKASTARSPPVVETHTESSASGTAAPAWTVRCHHETWAAGSPSKLTGGATSQSSWTCSAVPAGRQALHAGLWAAAFESRHRVDAKPSDCSLNPRS
jgi:hypothetical protein